MTRPRSPEVAAAVERIAGHPAPSQPPPAERLLVARGWKRLDSVRCAVGGDNTVVTYWRKGGHDFPQHFALWLESMNANLEWLLS